MKLCIVELHEHLCRMKLSYVYDGLKVPLKKVGRYHEKERKIMHRKGPL